MQKRSLCSPPLEDTQHHSRFILLFKVRGEPGFKEKGKRNCCIVGKMAEKMQPPFPDHSHRCAFVHLGTESTSLKPAFPLEQGLFQDSDLGSTGGDGFASLCPLGIYGGHEGYHLSLNMLMHQFHEVLQVPEPSER